MKGRKNNMDNKIGIILGGAALMVAAATAGLVHVKVRKIDKKLDDNDERIHKADSKIENAVKELADKTDVEVRDEIVNKAIKIAVERDVSKAVESAVRLIREDIMAEINQSVREEIRTQRDRVIGDVDRKLTEEVDRISRDDIVRDVQRKITSMMIDRMDSDLNSIKDQYRRKLQDNVDDLTKKYRDKLDDVIRDMDWQRLGYRIYKI